MLVIDMTMDVILTLAYLALGGTVGFALGLVIARGRFRWTHACAGSWGAVTVHLLTTSVWTSREVAARIPGIPVSPGTRAFYLMWDHPVMAAIAGATALFFVAYWSAIIIRGYGDPPS